MTAVPYGELIIPYSVADTEAEPAFDRLTQLVASLLKVPVARITFVDGAQQWVKSAFGPAFVESPATEAFCRHTLAQAGPLVVIDAASDRRYGESGGAPNARPIRFYAGLPLAMAGGRRIGTICGLDFTPHADVSEQDLASFCALGAITVDLLEARERAFVRRRNAQIATLAESLCALVRDAPGLRAAVDAVLLKLGCRYGAIFATVLRRAGSDGRYGRASAYQRLNPGGVASKRAPWVAEPAQADRSLCSGAAGLALEVAGRFDGDMLPAHLRAGAACQFLTLPLAAAGDGFALVLGFPAGDLDWSSKDVEIAQLRPALTVALTEKADNAQQHLLEAALDVLAESVTISDVDPADPALRRLLYVNERFCRMTGYTRHELVGQTHLFLQDAGPDGAGFERFGPDLTAGNGSSGLIGYRRKDGQRLDVELVPAAIPEQGEMVLPVVITHHDISAKLAKEREQSHLIELYRVLFDDNPTPMWIFDRQTFRFLRVNQAACTFYGWSHAEFLTMTLRDIRAPEQVAAMEQRVRSGPIAMADLSIWEHRRVDGSPVHVSGALRMHPGFGEQAMLAVVWDMTEISANRAELRRANQLLLERTAQLKDNLSELTQAEALAQIGSWHLSTDLQDMQWSDGFYDLIGQDRVSLPASFGNLLALVHPDDRTPFGQSVRDAASGSTRLSTEVRIVRPDGETRRFRIAAHLSPARPDGLHLFGYAQDISERWETEQAMMRSERLAILGHLTGGVAHDFNNLLTVITLNLEEAILDTPETDPLHDVLAPALQAAQRGAELTNQLLAYARQAPLRPQATSLADLLTAFGGLARRALGKDHRLETQAEIGRSMVLVDPFQMQTALLNIVLNAKLALPDGGIVVIKAVGTTLPAAGLGPKDAVPGRYALVSVTDQGCGMSGRILPHIFEPFFTTRRVGEGSGLGLSMADGFIRQSGGYTAAHSELGRGTTIELFLPLIEDAGEAAGIDGSGLGRPRALLVEDQPAVLATVSRMFRQLGYDICAVTSASAALAELFKGPAFAVLFTDIVLPGDLDGIGLAKEVSVLAPDTRILLTSGFSGHDLSRLDLPGVEILLKPYKRRQLLDRLNAIMDVSQNSR